MGLRTPPPSLRKPRVCSTTPNRAFLRGFPTTHFSDFGLCGRSRVSGTILGALSPHPKIPFPAGSLGCAAPQLFRVESERLKLPAPLNRWIAEALHAPPPLASTAPASPGGAL